MLGPKIIRDASADREPEPRPRETGIRRDNTGRWSAIRDGRLLGSFGGPGSKAAAIRVAGTNKVVS